METDFSKGEKDAFLPIAVLQTLQMCPRHLASKEERPSRMQTPVVPGCILSHIYCPASSKEPNAGFIKGAFSQGG